MAELAQVTLHITGPDYEQTVEVPLGALIFGRQSGNDVQLSSNLVSRQHARLVRDEAGCRLEDLSSSNGTLVNREVLEPEVPVPLNDGDLIEIGPFQLRFQQEVTPEEPEFIAPEALEPEIEPLSDAVSASEAPAGYRAEEGAADAVDELDELEVPQTVLEDIDFPIVPALEEEEVFVPEGPPAGQPPTPPPAPEDLNGHKPLSPLPPGLERYSTRLLEYLPPIYHSDFMSRFLAMFEAIFLPIENTVDGFDMFLDPQTAPVGFLPWLANWYLITFDDTWNEAQQRTFLKEAHAIYSRRGTRWAMERILEIYTGATPQIDDDSPNLEPLTFRVHIPRPESDFDRELVENLIDSNKPAHTIYQLTFAAS